MDKLMQLAAKRAAKKRKRIAQLRNKPKPRKTSKSKPDATPPAGTIEHDRLLTNTLRSAADIYNAALSAALKAGIEVQQQQLVEVRATEDGLAVHAEPIWLGRIIRRYK